MAHFSEMITHLEDVFKDNLVAMHLIENHIVEYDDVEDAITFVEQLMSYGCTSGLLPELIYTYSVQNFFIEHYPTISELIAEYEEEIGLIELGYDAVTTLTYLAVEMTADKLYSEMEAFAN